MTGSGADQLLALHDRIRACVQCPLHRTRTQAVPGDGPVTARIMAVGEAPGEKEDQQGVPFVGAAGRLLTRLLEGIGLQRSDMYIANVVKCRPPQNRDPEPAEVAACAHFLDEQVDLVRPDVILVLGRHATARLLPGIGPITRVHGQRIQQDGRTYVPLLHPAAALYNGSLLATLEEDMRRVRLYLVEAEAERRLRRWREAVGATPSTAVAPETAPSPPPPDANQLALF